MSTAGEFDRWADELVGIGAEFELAVDRIGATQH